MEKKLPVDCPSCGSKLKVKVMKCEQCDTLLDGTFSLPGVTMLDQNDQTFILNFVRHSGSIKKMARDLNLSYPTVRNRLDEIISRIEKLESIQK